MLCREQAHLRRRDRGMRGWHVPVLERAGLQLAGAWQPGSRGSTALVDVARLESQPIPSPCCSGCSVCLPRGHRRGQQVRAWRVSMVCAHTSLHIDTHTCSQLLSYERLLAVTVCTRRCYVPSSQSCGDAIEECEGDVCQYWSESPCVGTAAAAPVAAAPVAAASAAKGVARRPSDLV